MRGVEIKTFSIIGEEGACIKGYQDNMGEPYRSGITLWIKKNGADEGSGLFLEDHYLEQLISCLRLIRNKK